jgi:organic radical activating enzyme
MEHLAPKELIRVENGYPEVFQLTWAINGICNNACPYCVPALHAASNHGYKWENAKKFFIELFKRKEKINLAISGGEPTMSPFFTELCEMFYERNHTLGFTTNGIKSAEYYESISKLVNYICFSFHPQYDDGIELIKKVNSAKVNTKITVRVMMNPKEWDKSIKFWNEITKVDNICVESVRILDWGQADRETLIYTDEQIEWFNHNQRVEKDHIDNKEFVKQTGNFYRIDGTIDYRGSAVDYINAGFTDFFGWKCNIGIESMFIGTRGEIKGGNCYVGGNIGHLDDVENIRWPETGVTCDVNLCHCSTDVFINKWK